ncbi:ABC transporter ATP-binding protein [Spirochaeta cellobiosiphila]|uniref:ABC transporter ATP-binding protein n=1 Tax=Spirochaeta cellobiosiphila TaxID=504483 RepID=UPI00069E0918|nr:ABC transporter ATP-binding protein [Spirochaeta cellobiosiphila]
MKNQNNYAIKLISTHWLKFFLSYIFFLFKHSPVWLMPLYVSYLINTIVDKGSSGLITILWPSIGIGILLVLNILFNVLHIKIFSEASRKIEKDLRSHLIRKLQELSMGYYLKTKSGKLTAKFLRDVETIEMALKQGTMSLLPAITSFIYIFGVTTYKQPKVTLFFIASLPIMALIRFIYSKRMERTNTRYRKDMENLSAKVNESIEMLPVARAHALEDTEIENIEVFFDKINTSGLRLDVLNAAFGASTWVVLQLFSLLALVFTVYMASQGLIPVGDIVLYQGFFTMMSNSVGAVFNILPNLYKGRESFHSIVEVLNAPDIEYNMGKKAFQSVEGHFYLKDVTFTYNESDGDQREKHLDISILDIPSGQSVGIVGPSGSGKTTFINLLIGFVRPQKGEIFLDEQSYALHDMRSMRKNCAFVSQTPILFSGSIKANISYGDIQSDTESVITALKAANAWDFVKELPQGIDTILGEHGANLSGGQRQRLVLARAFYRDPQILFFDEATSALDTASEVLVQKAMDKLIENRTTFVIAHRLSTILHMDRILVMEKGHIIQDGSPDELLKQEGMFKELSKNQLKTGTFG